MQDISIFDLVVGDVLVFETGDILPADAIMITGTNVRYTLFAISLDNLPFCTCFCPCCLVPTTAQELVLGTPQQIACSSRCMQQQSGKVHVPKATQRHSCLSCHILDFSLATPQRPLADAPVCRACRMYTQAGRVTIDRGGRGLFEGYKPGPAAVEWQQGAGGQWAGPGHCCGPQLPGRHHCRPLPAAQ